MKVREARKNNDGAYEFERDFRELEAKLTRGDVPHEQQVRATAMILAQCFEIPVLELMRDQGFDAFCVKVEAGQFLAEPGATQTKFTRDDLRFIYAYILQVLDTRIARGQIRATTVDAPGRVQ